MSESCDAVREVRGYCVHCWSHCPTIATVENGVFTRVQPDKDHPNAVKALCPKALAGPELVYSPERIAHPMIRTRPKGDPDPGWKRISWDEALDITASRLNQIKAKYGAEAVAFHRSSNGGSQASDFNNWALRLNYAFGSPTNLSTTHICNWARDGVSSYTYGSGLFPEMEHSSCILIWGQNPHDTWLGIVRDIGKARKKGAKLIVIDPRETPLAKQADLWLQVLPGTDLEPALALLNVMISEGLYDRDFVLRWTTAPLLVRTDTGDLLRAEEIDGGRRGCYVVWDTGAGAPGVYEPQAVALPAGVEPALEGEYTVPLASGARVRCKSAFQLLAEAAGEVTPEKAERITKVHADKIRQAARLYATIKPASYYTWNGIEMQTNSSQINRAVCLLYTLTGNFDTRGSSRRMPHVMTSNVAGYEFLSPETERKRLGSDERPLGPAGLLQPQKATRASSRPNDFFRAVLEGIPFPMKALVSFGGNLIVGNPESHVAYKALSSLEFYVHAEHFMTPATQLADIVLPAASFWETWDVKAGFRHSQKASSHVQLRQAVVPPRHESKPDRDIIFALAQRLGLADKFWNGDTEQALNHVLKPCGLTLEELRRHPGGITLDLPVRERGYAEIDARTGCPRGFNTPTRRLEIFNQLFKDHGYDPIPISRQATGNGAPQGYPLLLTTFKLREYSHGSGRCLPMLRRLAPEPYVEIHPDNARELGVGDGEWVAIETEHGGMRAKARLTDTIMADVVATQHGWWQACPELNQPGYDLLSPAGSNVNLLFTTREYDPLLGTYQMKGVPCKIRKL